MKIEVNNGGWIEIERTFGGVNVWHFDRTANIERRDKFTGAEIVTVLNLLRYMKDKGEDSVKLSDGDFRLF